MSWKIPTLIFRLKTDSEGIIVPGIEWLCRHSDALFEQTEWYWAADIDSAFRFEDMEPADAYLATLREAGEEHAHTYIFSGTAKAAQKEREHDRLKSLGRRAPAESYAELERRNLA